MFDDSIRILMFIVPDPEITFGNHTRVALDVGCVVASFGAYLFSRNVLTMYVAPKDVHENQIQFALERGVLAMVAAFATRRFLYPSQAFDLIPCSRCRVNSTRDGIGIRVCPCWWVCTVEMVVICYGG
ncbi:putative S-adenosyl-L-methionine-dependent methyltransferase [Helianthus annuus]|nr:putative S-adenosyl-L-methionine-dependent methyltransferase [Helianthus annuus]